MSESTNTFKILYFAGVASYTGKTEDTFPAPLSVVKLFETVESRYPGIKEKVLGPAMVTVNLDYVDLEDGSVVIQSGDEVAIIPPVSSG